MSTLASCCRRRACPGDPDRQSAALRGVDARVKPGHDNEQRWLSATSRETKLLPAALAGVAEDGGFEGYASLFGVADLGKDLVVPGAFAESLARRGSAGVRMLWQHPRGKNWARLPSYQVPALSSLFLMSAPRGGTVMAHITATSGTLRHAESPHYPPHRRRCCSSGVRARCFTEGPRGDASDR
jgi:Caudovirus prohead serine protease